MAGTKKSTAQLYIDRLATIFSNGTNSINGADHAKFEDDVIASMANKITDNTLLGLFPYETARIYYISQAVIYDDGTGDAIYICNNATTTGVWNASHWDRISKAERSGIVNITTDPQIITFSSPMPSTNYVFTYRLYDSVTLATDGASSNIYSKSLPSVVISSPLIGANVYIEYFVKEV